MQNHEIFLLFCRKFEELGIDYMVTGSVASILYGDPRLTHDIDLVVVLKPSKVASLVEAFPLEEFYCPPEEVIRVEISRIRRGHFNFIHHDTGFKADVYLANDSSICVWALKNTRTISLDGADIQVAPPEYVILNKLLFYKEGGSEKHLQDIRGILDGETEVDTEFLAREAAGVGVLDILTPLLD